MKHFELKFYRFCLEALMLVIGAIEYIFTVVWQEMSEEHFRIEKLLEKLEEN